MARKIHTRGKRKFRLTTHSGGAQRLKKMKKKQAQKLVWEQAQQKL